jgi:uncharacterized protein YprB with RNaseH-like and TPR domain
MLQSTFSHIQGIGLSTERKFWQSGLCTWDDAAGYDYTQMPMPPPVEFVDSVHRSREELAAGNAHFFYEGLRNTEHWRLFPHFRSRAAFFDIETTGLGKSWTHITTIALFDGVGVKYYVHGRNLEQFAIDIMDYDMLVTYNGKCFDVPFVEKFFGITLPHVHIDLRFVLSSLGFKGGLKGAERQMGFNRGELDGVDGYYAVLLWDEYNKFGNEAALQTLVAYNILDVVTLELFAVEAYNRKLAEAGLPDWERYRIEQIRLAGCEPTLPLQPDLDVLKYLRRKYNLFSR